MKFAISSGHEIVSQAALDTYKAGGNIFDALLSACFTSCVAEPLLTSLGGGGYALIQKSESQQPIAFDFFARFPGQGTKVEAPVLTEIPVYFKSSTQTFHSGKGSIAVPGLLKGLLYLFDRYCSLPLEKILTPAIHLAEEGHSLNKTQSHVAELLIPILRQSFTSKNLFLNGGNDLQRGTIYQNIEFANYLRTIANNPRATFYHSPLAETIEAQIKNHSPLNADNLKSYQVIETKPLFFTYRGFKVYSTGTPALGGTSLEVILKDMERTDFSNLEWGSSDHLMHLYQSLKILEDHEINPYKKGTTHISIVDHHFSISLSMTNGEGSGYYPPNTGIMLNNMLGEEDVCGDDHKKWTPGKPLPSMMAPTIIETPMNKKIILGSGGSKRIRSSLVQVISNLIDFKMDLSTAVHSPRINWDGHALHIEKGFRPEEILKLNKKVNTNQWEGLDFFFGGVHCIDTHLKKAVGDTRRGGCGLVLKY